MKKICEWCKCEYKAAHEVNKYCSRECARMAQRKLNHLKREARARELGITMEELIKRTKRGSVGLNAGHPKRAKRQRPKTYAEIRAYNAVHPLKLGWRR